MKPSERVNELIASCLELWTEKARQQATTNSLAPTKEEFEELLRSESALQQGILIEAYASAILTAMDEEHERMSTALTAIWNKLRDMNGGPFPGDP